MEFIKMLIELFIGYLTIFAVVKFLGKTQINQITPFDFISALVLGNFIGETIFNNKLEILLLVSAIVVWGLFIYMTEWFTQKSMKLRKVLEGSPSILIKNNHIIWKELKRNRVDLSQLMQLLRGQGIFSIQDVEYAILEASGNLSVLKKSNLETPTYEDMKIHVAKNELPIIIVMDGQLMVENILENGFNEEWVQKKLTNYHLKDICFAEWYKNKLFIQRY